MTRQTVTLDLLDPDATARALQELAAMSEPSVAPHAPTERAPDFGDADGPLDPRPPMLGTHYRRNHCGCWGWGWQGGNSGDCRHGTPFWHPRDSSGPTDRDCQGGPVRRRRRT